MTETVEQFLARGGQIQQIEQGLSGKDMTSRYDRKKKRGVNINIPKKETYAPHRSTNR